MASGPYAGLSLQLPYPFTGDNLTASPPPSPLPVVTEAARTETASLPYHALVGVCVGVALTVFMGIAVGLKFFYRRELRSLQSRWT